MSIYSDCQFVQTPIATKHGMDRVTHSPEAKKKKTKKMYSTGDNNNNNSKFPFDYYYYLSIRRMQFNATEQKCTRWFCPIILCNVPVPAWGWVRFAMPSRFINIRFWIMQKYCIFVCANAVAECTNTHCTDNTNRFDPIYLQFCDSWTVFGVLWLSVWRTLLCGLIMAEKWYSSIHSACICIIMDLCVCVCDVDRQLWLWFLSVLDKGKSCRARPS